MYRIRMIFFVVFLGIIFHGCGALEYFDGSSKEEISRFQNPKGWDEIDKLRAGKMNSDKKISDLENEVRNLKKNMNPASKDNLKNTYYSLISNLKVQLKEKNMTIEKLEKQITITFVDSILFESGRTTITPEGINILNNVGLVLKNQPEMQIRIMGYTDNIPIKKELQHKFPSNWELSAARAAAVVRYFQGETGLDPRRLEAVGRSFYRPVASNKTDEGRAQNRRVEIIIGPNLEK